MQQTRWSAGRHPCGCRQPLVNHSSRGRHIRARNGHIARFSYQTVYMPGALEEWEGDIYSEARAACLYATLPPLGPFESSTCGQSSPSQATTAQDQQDNFFSRVLLTLLCRGLASQLEREGQMVRVPMLCQYSDFVRVSKAIMQHGRTPMQQEMLIRRALNSIIPGGSGLFRAILGKNGGTSKWAAELNALMATLTFGWLVGDMELRGTEVLDPKGQMRSQMSVVHIKKCRFLDASSCVSSCVNLCKAPTQAFFTEEAGILTTLKPDFESLSCDIIFGQAPLARQDDAAFTQPCFAANCSLPTADGRPTGHRAAVLAAAAAAAATSTEAKAVELAPNLA